MSDQASPAPPPAPAPRVGPILAFLVLLALAAPMALLLMLSLDAASLEMRLAAGVLAALALAASPWIFRWTGRPDVGAALRALHLPWCALMATAGIGIAIGLSENPVRFDPDPQARFYIEESSAIARELQFRQAELSRQLDGYLRTAPGELGARGPLPALRDEMAALESLTFALSRRARDAQEASVFNSQMGVPG